MRIIFAGTPRFAAAALAALKAANHEIVLVLTQPDRQAGRGMKLRPSETAEEASRLNLHIEKPTTLKDAATQAMLRDAKADVMVVAAYGLILPQAVLDIPLRGCLNIHASLLPRWRGAAPIQRAIEAGDSVTGIAIMQMDAGLDTGPVLLEKRIPIDHHLDTSAILFEKMTVLGAQSIVEVIAQLSQFPPHPQPASGVTYACKIEKSEAAIDWRASATVLERRIRAFDPFPGCEAQLGNETLKIWRASVVTAKASQAPGTILPMTTGVFTVQCGQDALAVEVVQKAGGKRLATAEFLRGMAINGAAVTYAAQLGSVLS